MEAVICAPVYCLTTAQLVLVVLVALLVGVLLGFLAYYSAFPRDP